MAMKETREQKSWLHPLSGARILFHFLEATERDTKTKRKKRDEWVAKAYDKG